MRGGWKASVPFFAASTIASGMIRPKLGETGRALVLSPRRPAGRAPDSPRWKESGYFAEADRDGGVSGRRIALAKLGDGPIGMDL